MVEETALFQLLDSAATGSVKPLIGRRFRLLFKIAEAPAAGFLHMARQLRWTPCTCCIASQPKESP